MLGLKPKQHKVIETLNNPSIDTIVLFGTVGTGKTDIAAHAVLSMAYKFPKTYWPVFRANLTTAKRSVIPSYLEMIDKMGFIEGTDYKYNRSENYIQFTENKSVIPFIEADITKDRDGKKIKGINATGNHIDEVDELQLSIALMAMSRKGRRNEFGQPSVSILTLNPADGWTKEMFYDPYINGTLPPNIACIEFGLEDSWQTKQDIDSLKQNPTQWTKRYLYNDWNYGDDSSALFKYRHMDRQHVEKITPDLRYGAEDVARSGNDRSVIAMFEGRTLVDIAILKEKDEVKDTADQADEVAVYMEENLIGYENFGVDAVGIGVGVVDNLKRKDLYVHEFMSGASSTETMTVKNSKGEMVEVPKYNNKRSEIAHRLAQDIEAGEVFFYSGCPFLSEFKKEATMHNYETKDKQLVLESKDKVKQRLGHSPDVFDAVLMAYERVLNAQGSDFVPSTGGSYDSMFNSRRN